MSVSIDIQSDPETVIEALFPVNDRGHVSFGFAGESIEPKLTAVLPNTHVRVRDYMMETFIAYSVRVVPADFGTSIVIENVTDDREETVQWFCKKYIASKGMAIIDDSPA